jgi:hypothetical protein
MPIEDAAIGTKCDYRVVKSAAAERAIAFIDAAYNRDLLLSRSLAQRSEIVVREVDCVLEKRSVQTFR